MNAERKHRERSNSEQAIMAAAEELFLENGYSKTTTTMIAARAGVTHAMLHYYFRTKEHIFIKVVDKYMDELLDSFQPLMRKQAPFWETLETGISAHFDFLLKHPSLPAFLYDTLRYNPELIESWMGRITGTLRRIALFHGELIRKEMDAGRIRRVDPVQLMLDIVTLNISPFLLLPAARNMLDGTGGGRLSGIMEGRKAEIIALIRARLYGDDINDSHDEGKQN
ncbi:MAG TPA: TetR/AcrR family transcriptional regulator [Candidatus Cryptobacteroides excrementigallinarum]|nr:TetR/AcrR family transcriptional regulator [Candidatus Cryptobacteroides excrementigallinarum]